MSSLIDSRDVALTGTASKENLPVGTEVVKEAIESPFVNTIVESKKQNATKAVVEGGESDGKGTGTTIKYNPTYFADGPQGILDENGKRGRLPYIGLAHELIHTGPMNKGTVDSSPTNYKDPDTGVVGLIDRDEFRTRQKDSMIRKEQNQPQRTVPSLSRKY